MRKRMAALALLLAILLALSGCAPLSGLFGTGDSKKQQETLTNGTTTGNILNGGFAVKDGDDLLFYYSGGSVYPKGTLVRSNPDTGDNSKVADKAGLYMNLVDGVLYDCREDGIFGTPLNTLQSEKILDGEYTQLQISGGHMYYINNGAIGCASLDGSAVDFSPVEKAACLNIYGDMLDYIDTDSGHIKQASMDGSNVLELYDKPVTMFYIIDDVIYFIDSEDGLLKRMALKIDIKSIETLTDKTCSGFNVNRNGLYYTLKEDGLCYNAGTDGLQAQKISDFGKSTWHLACLFGDGALVIKQEDIAS